jgi:DNA-binding PadR family transcriptional regulator
VTSELGDPTPERGGKAKRCFTVTPAGREELRTSRAALKKLGAGLERLIGG